MQSVKTLAFVLVAAVVGHHAATAATHAGSSGETSGPAIGTPVDPSTVVQKRNPFIRPETLAGQSGVPAGSPGIEGKADTQSGTAPGR